MALRRIQLIPQNLRFGKLNFLANAVFAFILIVVCPVRAEDLIFERHVINDQTDYSAAALIDVNRDGQLDIVCGGDWYEGPDWKKHFVAEIPRIGGRPDGFSHLEFDVNRDGWMDVITVNYRSRSIKWMQHPGESLGPWTVHTAVEPGPMETGRLVDIDGDGQLDLLPNGANFAAWWEFRWNENSPGGAPAWIRHDLPSEAGGHGLGFGDINGDGRGDIVGQSGWLEAPEDARYGSWQWHADYSIERGSIPMLVVDPDEDGDNDIVWCSAHGFGVYWLEQTVNGLGERTWVRHAIDTSWSQGHSPLWFDLDGNGQMELITGKRYMAHGGADPGEYDPIVAYRYEFDKAKRTWKRWILSPVGDRVGMGLDPKVSDMDGDGDLDLLASGRSGLYWLENRGPGTSARLESRLLKYADHRNLLWVNSSADDLEQIEEPEAWGLRRHHVVTSIERAHGNFPDSSTRVPLDQTVTDDSTHQEFQLKTVRYQVDRARQTRARLFVPNSARQGTANAVVCAFGPEQQELAEGIAQEMASQGFVCVVPQMLPPQIRQTPMDEVWQIMRAADLLQACNAVHGERIGFVGNALDGQLGLYVAALDPRFIVTVCDATQTKSLPGTRSNADYSLAELIAAIAPRSLNFLLPEDPALAAAFEEHARYATPVFALLSVPESLQVSRGGLQSTHRASILDWLKASFQTPKWKRETATAVTEKASE